MIYIVIGTDLKKRNTYLESIVKSRDEIRFTTSYVDREQILAQVNSTTLFGESPILIAENILSASDISFSKSDLTMLQDSLSAVIFLEDSLTSVVKKKYEKYAHIETIEEKKKSASPASNPFALSDAFGRRDKIRAWMLYCEAIEKGTEPEIISGMLFWKIKTMILQGQNLFSVHELKHHSRNLVSLYHESHKGQKDFIIGLEQFILTALSK